MIRLVSADHMFDTASKGAQVIQVLQPEQPVRTVEASLKTGDTEPSQFTVVLTQQRLWL